MMTHILPDIDFKTITNDPDFKEDSVREVIIVPLLKQLGYQQENIERSKTLKHPFLKVGSKKRKINLIPDYVLKVGDRYAWVLDAKSPNKNIKEGDNLEDIAERVGENSWRLQREGQLSLF